MARFLGGQGVKPPTQELFECLAALLRVLVHCLAAIRGQGLDVQGEFGFGNGLAVDVGQGGR